LNICDVSCSELSITKRLAQCGDMNPQIALIDNNTRPNPVYQLCFVDNIARLLDKGNEKVERPISYLNARAIPFDESLRRH
jgi:hypothetical protein